MSLEELSQISDNMDMNNYQVGFINKKKNTIGFIGEHKSESGLMENFIAYSGIPIIDVTKIPEKKWNKAIKGRLSVTGCSELEELIQELLSTGGVLLPQDNDQVIDQIADAKLCNKVGCSL